MAVDAIRSGEAAPTVTPNQSNKIYRIEAGLVDVGVLGDTADIKQDGQPLWKAWVYFDDGPHFVEFTFAVDGALLRARVHSAPDGGRY